MCSGAVANTFEDVRSIAYNKNPNNNNNDNSNDNSNSNNSSSNNTLRNRSSPGVTLEDC